MAENNKHHLDDETLSFEHDGCTVTGKFFFVDDGPTRKYYADLICTKPGRKVTAPVQGSFASLPEARTEAEHAGRRLIEELGM
jgi:hypothetical protein